LILLINTYFIVKPLSYGNTKSRVQEFDRKAARPKQHLAQRKSSSSSRSR